MTRRDRIDQFSIVSVKHGRAMHCAVAVKLGAVTCRKARVMFRQVERSISIVLWCYGFVQQGEVMFCGAMVLSSWVKLCPVVVTGGVSKRRRFSRMRLHVARI